MTAPVIRALVVDDQPLARERLLALLAEEPGLELAGVCATGAEAVDAIRALAPDLVFLDMQMPELDGLGVVEAVGVDAMPPVIFVTAFDEYAIRAFEAQALDYLLKPFARPRFQQAVARARRDIERRRRAALSGQLMAVVAALRPPAAAVPRVMVKRGGRVSFVDVDRIDWVEADGNYVRLHTHDGVHLLRDTLTTVLDRLGPERFARIHRSRLVRVARVAELHVAGGGDCEVVLYSGERLGLSRSYREQVEQRLLAGEASPEG